MSDRWHQKSVKRSGGIKDQVYRRDIDGTAKMKHLAEIYKTAEKSIVERLKVMTNGSPTKAFLEEQKKAIDEILKRLHKEGAEAVKDGVGATYRGGFRAGRSELIQAGVLSAESQAEMGNIHTKAADIYAGQVLSRLADVETTAGRTVKDIYNQVRLNTELAGAVTGVETVSNAQKRLERASKNGGLVAFVDKAGRQWNMSSYTEMLARTTLMQVHNRAKELEFMDHGEDLIVVSSHLPTCDMCLPYNGAILSLSGSNPDYPSLEQAETAGLFHPNCRHSFSLYIDPNGAKLNAEPDVADLRLDEAFDLAENDPRRNGYSIPLDSDMLEGQEMHIDQYIDENGKNRIRLTGKITEKYHGEFYKALKALGKIQGNTYKDAKDLEFHADPSGNKSGKLDFSAGSARGKWVLSDGRNACSFVEGNGARISFFHVGNYRIPYEALRGLFSIDIEAGGNVKPVEKLREILSPTGMNLEKLIAERTAQDKDIYKMRLILWQMNENTHNDKTGTNLYNALSAELAKHGVDKSALSELEWREVAEGHSAFVWKDRSKEYEKLGARYIFSGFNAATDFDVGLVADTFVKNGIGHISSLKRALTGAFEELPAGSSSTPHGLNRKDLDTGGANGVFARLLTNSANGEKYESSFRGEGIKFIYDLKILDRTDWYCYNRDEFGTTSGSTWYNRPGTTDFVAKEQRRYNPGNEMIFREGIHPSNIRLIVCADTKQKKSLEQALSDRGISEINGVPVGKFIIVQKYISVDALKRNIKTP